MINAECFVQHRELGMFDFTARPFAEKKGFILGIANEHSIA